MGMRNMDMLIYSFFEQTLYSFDSCLGCKDFGGPMGRPKGPFGHTYAWHNWALPACLVDTVLATPQSAFRPP